MGAENVSLEFLNDFDKSFAIALCIGLGSIAASLLFIERHLAGILKEMKRK